ncbi:MAG: hypothetical protein DME22_12590 [Verrucomicrobia bacterium]|nr:MAG: hypothetical protein DME22_12590 [Verrucomicrobiota bacterium]PYK03092.1 MAG: hypothetical protein DME23_00490 [Verrucomicrobiota bacterium]
MANNLKFEKKAAVIAMLCEGASIRSIERITGVNRNTIMSLGLRVGKVCVRILDEKMRGLNCRNIEVDEIWGFIGKKEKRATHKESMIIGVGDVWTFIALDADTKLIPSFVVGRRDSYHAKAFMEDLAGRLSRRVQLSSDALASYPEAVERGFGGEVDYAQLIKTYAVVKLKQGCRQPI